MTQMERVGQREQAARNLLDEIRKGIPPNVAPEDAIRATMCSFTRHLTGGVARRVLRALSPDVRPLLDACIIHRSERATRFGRDELLRRVADHLEVSPLEAEQVAVAVLEGISSRLPEKVLFDVATQLPHDLRTMWFGRARSEKIEEGIAPRETMRQAIRRTVPRSAAPRIVAEALSPPARHLSVEVTRHHRIALELELRRFAIALAVVLFAHVVTRR